MQFIMGNEKKLGAEYLCNVAILQLRKKNPHANDGESKGFLPA
jgi:hypothetical protein